MNAGERRVDFQVGIVGDADFEGRIGAMMALVCTDPITWWVKFTRSVSYWKWPALTV